MLHFVLIKICFNDENGLTYLGCLVETHFKTLSLTIFQPQSHSCHSRWMGAAYKWENYQVTIMTNISPHFGLQLLWFSLNWDVFDDDECLLVTKWKHYKWLKWKGWTNIKLLLKTSSLSVEPLRSGFFLILLLFKPSSNHRFLQLKRKKGCSLWLTCFCSPPIPWYQLGLGGLFYRRRPPANPPSQFLAPYAVHFSKQRHHAMTEGIWRKEVERSSMIFHKSQSQWLTFVLDDSKRLA